MKKIALTSLLAVAAVSGAHAANVIDGNPLYMPKAGHFYSVTSLGSSSRTVDVMNLGEEFGYGITNKLAVSVATGLTQANWFDTVSWNNVALNATFRALDKGAYKVDAFAGYSAGGLNLPGGATHGGLVIYDGDDTTWFEKEQMDYVWNLGVRAGYTTGDFTIAGHVAMKYWNTESFNWGDEGAHMLVAGVDTQVALNKSLNLTLGAEYQTEYEKYSDKMGRWQMTFGANYNIDATKYVGAYITKDIVHNSLSTVGEWNVEDGFGIGAKFGIDF